MRHAALTLALLVTTPAIAQDGPLRVVGGQQAPLGAWPDAAGVVFNGYVGCTGTLIAPDLVVTAAHCVRGIDVRAVLLDSNDWTSEEGELIEVARAIPHLRADIAVLVLAEEASVEPRPVAFGCVVDDYLEDGAPAAIVGYGLTSPSQQFNTRLMEGVTTIVDHDCSNPWLGCDTSLPTGSELYAGGDGVDACSGDSGGPLYLLTEVGDYVVGVTSRGPEGCRDGAIWVRPDAFIDWIEERTGREIPEPTCNFPPEPVDPETMFVPSGRTRKLDLEVVDPDGDTRFSWSVIDAPMNGTVEVDENGRVTYTADRDFVGQDHFTIGATDTGFPAHTAPIFVDVEVYERSFLGCSSTGGAPLAAGTLLAMAAVGLRRRRR